jgi:hypothetical protein
LLVEGRLRPAGLLRERDGSEPTVRKRRPLLALSFRYAVSDPRATRRLTDPLTWLFRPAVVAIVLGAFAVVSTRVLGEKGLASGARQVLDDPVVILVVFGLGLLSAGFHELGHAAACRYGGATPGVMGVALYLVWPAFYTDVRIHRVPDERCGPGRRHCRGAADGRHRDRRDRRPRCAELDHTDGRLGRGDGSTTTSPSTASTTTTGSSGSNSSGASSPSTDTTGTTDPSSTTSTSPTTTAPSTTSTTSTTSSTTPESPAATSPTAGAVSPD